MKTITEYRAETLIILGDTAGKRYSEAQLDNAGQTSVPDSLMLTVCTGAAGYAMRIRARSVTEVFGKRPEDTDKLIEQAQELIRQYETELRSPSNVRDPLPRGGFKV